MLVINKNKFVNLRWKRACYVLLLLLSVPLPASAQEAADAWASNLWNECYDVHTIGFDERMESFTKLINLGKSWQRSVDENKIALDAVTDKTCKKWAASPNGDTYLKEFQVKYGDASGLALSLEDEATNYLVANLESWNKLQEKEVGTLESFPSGDHNLKWRRDFPCSGAFSRATTHIKAEIRVLEQKLARLRKECPHGADDTAMQAGAASAPAATSNAAVNGNTSKSTAPVPQGTSGGSGSDITGTGK